MKKILLILCAIVIVSCSSSDDSDGGGPDNSEFSFYTTATIDGTAFSVGIPIDASVATDYGSSYGYQPQYNNDGGCININYESSLYPAFNETKPAMSVGFIGFMANASLTCSDEVANFDTLFPVGAYTYAESAYNSFGAKVDYVASSDGDAPYYTSYGEQNSNATFSITNVEAYDCGFNKCVTVIGTFSCRLYNSSDDTDFIDVTNGTFKLSVKSYNP